MRPKKRWEMKDWNTAVRIGAHIITLNLILAILVALFFLIVEKTEHQGPIPTDWITKTIDPE